MSSYINVSFEHMAPDPSIEASVHRWVARLETSHLPIQGGSAKIEQTGRRLTVVYLKLDLTDGATAIATTVHQETYVAVADAFRAARRELIARSVASGWGRGAMAFAG